MSGTISVESPNKFSGTSFYVDLPITVDAGGTHE